MTLNLPDPDIENDPDVRFLAWLKTANEKALINALGRHTPLWRIEAIRRAMARRLGVPTSQP